MKRIVFAFISIFLMILLTGVYSGILSKGSIRSYNNETLVRHRRYMGLSRRYKLNHRYQDCIGPGDSQGHCKHAAFCPMDVIGSSRNILDYLCIIAKAHVGVCCPDDIVLAGAHGSQVVMNLPASGTDYDEEDRYTGCGLNSLARTGQEIKNPVQKWPWIAAIYTTDQPNEQFCGGAVITDQHILTAAHCFRGCVASDIGVRLGEYDFTKLNETRSRNFNVQMITIHEDYNDATYENDIAILKLENATTFNTYIWPICLPPVNILLENETATVGGWGQISLDGPTSEVLREVSVPIWEQEKCVDSFTQRITENSFCAAGYEGAEDSCKGDSGGPLLYQLSNGRWIIVGVVSWGVGCGDKGKPGIYTRVNKYIPWIVKHTIAK